MQARRRPRPLLPFTSLHHRNQQRNKVHRYLLSACPPHPIDHPPSNHPPLLKPFPHRHPHLSPETSSSLSSSFPSSNRTHPDSYHISCLRNASAINPLAAKRAIASSISWPSLNFSKTSISVRSDWERAKKRSSGTLSLSFSPFLGTFAHACLQHGGPDAHSDRATRFT